MTPVTHAPAKALVAIGTSYFVLACAAIELTRLSGGIALMWVANGVLIAALGSTQPKRWRPAITACIVACFTATLILRHSLIAALGFSIANSVEAVVAVLLMRRWGAHRSLFEDVRSVMVFALCAGVIGPASAAVIGAATAWQAFGLGFVTTWRDWAAGHGLGTLIAAPLVVLVSRPDLRAGWRHPTRGDAAIGTGLLLLVAITTIGVFAQNTLPLMFLPALPMLWTTFRLGRTGAAGALLIIALVGGWATMLGRGPIHLVAGTAAFQLQFFQIYLATLFLMALPTAAMLARQRKLYGRLRESEAALRLLADHSTDVLLSLDVDGAIRFASPSVRNLGGYDPDALIGRNAIELIEPAHRALVQRAHLDALATPEHNVTVEYQAQRRDGSLAWFETNTRAVRDGEGTVTGVVSAIRDVSHRKSVERQLRLAADTDPLTGLANRRPFMVALERAIAQAATTPAVLALVDLDHFKRVNDRHGHAAGDAALVTIAEVCRRELRIIDVIARIGGEELAILLEGASMSEAEPVCERLRRAIAAQPILAVGAPLFRVTGSFGLVSVGAGLKPDAVIAAADAALYAAKDAGRNRLKIAA